MRQEVSHINVKQAFYRWYSAQDVTYGSAVRSFYKFTGITSFLSDRHIVTEEQARRINLMAGAHGATLIKAWMANHGGG